MSLRAVCLTPIQSSTSVLSSRNRLHMHRVDAPCHATEMVDGQRIGDRTDQQLVCGSVGVARPLPPVAYAVNVTKPRPALTWPALVDACPEPLTPVCVVPPADLDNVYIAMLGPPSVVSCTPPTRQMLTSAALKRAYSGIKGHDLMIAFNAAQAAFLAKWIR